MQVGDIDVYTIEVESGTRVYVSNVPTLQETEVKTVAEARVLAATLAKTFGFKVTFPKEG